MTYSPANTESPFAPTTKVFETKDPETLRYTLTESYTVLANSINQRELAYFESVETQSGQTFPDPNNAQNKLPVFRKTFDIGAIAPGATLNTAHGITGITRCTNIYGTCVTNVIDFRPLPRVSATLVTDQVSLDVDSTNIIIVNGATAPAITSAKVILEYLKS